MEWGLVLLADTISAARFSPLQRIARAEDERVYADGVLRRFLADPGATVRRRAVLAVGRLQDSTAIPDLLPLLADSDPEVKREAIFALGQIGLAQPGAAAQARGALEKTLPGADVATAGLALEALGKLGDRGATPLVASYLENAEPLLRGEAAVALWRLADSTALDPLLAHVDDPDPGVRWRAIYALEKIVDPDRVVLMAVLHLEDAEWLTRAYAARTLGRQKSPRATAYLLQRLAEEGDVGVAVNILRALQAIADTSCGSCLGALASQLDAAHPYVRLAAATALSDRFAWAATDSAGRVKARGRLADIVAKDQNPATRGAAARALLARRGAAALADVQPLLADTSLYARVALLDALTLLPEAAAVPLLTPRLEHDAPLFERMTAAEALGRLHAKAASPRLRAALADTAVLFAASAAAALADLGDSTAVGALAHAYAARAADADADARISIRDALRTLAGRAFADSVERAHPARNASTPYDSAFFAPPDVKGAVLHTTAGDIEWAFYAEEAPQTVKSFARLAARGYFDGLSVHRVVPNFVIQDGDPTGTGSGGPGYTIRCEYNRLRYDPGMVGMALSGKDTGGSQWFITHSPQMHLNGRYTIFARVTRGMDVVHRVVQGDRVVKVELVR